MTIPLTARQRNYTAAQALSTSSTGFTSYELKLERSQPNLRLAGFEISIRGYCQATPGSAWPDGLVNVLNRIQLFLADKGTERTAIDIAGTTSMWLRAARTGRMSRYTKRWLGSQGLASTAFRLDFPIYLAPEGLSENVGDQFSVPLSKKVLAEDPRLVLSFDGDTNMGTSSDIRSKSGGTADAVQLYVRPLYKTYASEAEALAVPYVKQEIKTSTIDWSTHSPVRYDAPGDGILLGLMAEHFATAATSGFTLYDRTATVLSNQDTDKWTISYAGTGIEQASDEDLIARTDLDQVTEADNPAAVAAIAEFVAHTSAGSPTTALSIAAQAALNYRNSIGVWYYDLIQQLPGSNAGNLNSAIDLSKGVLSFEPSTVAASRFSRFTTWKIVG